MSFDSEIMSLEPAFSRYVRFLLLLLVLPTIVLALGGAFYYQPYWGPLTRIGGYLENDYGWNQQQEEFDKPLSDIVWSLNDYDRYYDVVVVGDSFSYDEKKGWQNYFVDVTGLSVITLSHKIGLSHVLESEMFRTKPPRYLVFESLEQFSLARLKSYSTLTPLARIEMEQGHPVDSPSHVSLNANRKFVNRVDIPPLGAKKLDNTETRISQALDYLIKRTQRMQTKEPSVDYLRSMWQTDMQTGTFTLSLRSLDNALFSSRETRKLLVYSLDLTKPTADVLIKQAAEGAWRMKQAIEANGRTKVLTMIFPDKLTVYTPYLEEPSVAPPSIIPQLANHYPDQVRLDGVYAQAVASGVVDLYLPDDTHCGYKGYKLAAEQMVHAISRLEQ